MDHFLVDPPLAQGKVSLVWHPGLPWQEQACLCLGRPAKEKETEGGGDDDGGGEGGGGGAGMPWQSHQFGSRGRNTLFLTLLLSQQRGCPPRLPEADSPCRPCVLTAL